MTRQKPTETGKGRPPMKWAMPDHVPISAAEAIRCWRECRECWRDLARDVSNRCVRPHVDRFHNLGIRCGRLLFDRPPPVVPESTRELSLEGLRGLVLPKEANTLLATTPAYDISKDQGFTAYVMWSLIAGQVAQANHRLFGPELQGVADAYIPSMDALLREWDPAAETAPPRVAEKLSAWARGFAEICGLFAESLVPHSASGSADGDADEDYRSGRWFGEVLAARLRHAAGSNRKGLIVRRRVINGVACYHLGDARRCWPEDIAKLEREKAAAK